MHALCPCIKLLISPVRKRMDRDRLSVAINYHLTSFTIQTLQSTVFCNYRAKRSQAPWWPVQTNCTDKKVRTKLFSQNSTDKTVQTKQYRTVRTKQYGQNSTDKTVRTKQYGQNCDYLDGPTRRLVFENSKCEILVN